MREQLAELVAEWARQFRERWSAADSETRSKPTQFYYDQLDSLHDNIREQFANVSKEEWLQVATLVANEIPEGKHE